MDPQLSGDRADRITRTLVSGVFASTRALVPPTSRFGINSPTFSAADSAPAAPSFSPLGAAAYSVPAAAATPLSAAASAAITADAVLGVRTGVILVKLAATDEAFAPLDVFAGDRVATVLDRACSKNRRWRADAACLSAFAVPAARALSLVGEAAEAAIMRESAPLAAVLPLAQAGLESGDCVLLRLNPPTAAAAFTFAAAAAAAAVTPPLQLGPAFGADADAAGAKVLRALGGAAGSTTLHKLVTDKDGEGMTALLRAARAGRQQEALALLEAGAAPDAVDGRKRTALHLAAHQGHAALCRSLADRCVPLEACDAKGKTALRLACQHLKDDAAQSLLQAGARPYARALDGRAPLDYVRLETLPKTHSALLAYLDEASLRAGRAAASGGGDLQAQQSLRGQLEREQRMGLDVQAQLAQQQQQMQAQLQAQMEATMQLQLQTQMQMEAAGLPAIVEGGEGAASPPAPLAFLRRMRSTRDGAAMPGPPAGAS